MASCTQVSGMIQAYIDGELSHSERVIVEQHLGECGVCKASLRKAQRVSVLLFESFGPYRLRRGFQREVLEHLPEMEPAAVDIAGLNWRLKHPTRWWVSVTRWVPVAFMVLLICVGIIIRSNWPEREPGANSLGYIVQAMGQPTCTAKAAESPTTAALERLVERGDRYETGPGDLLMLALKGVTPTLLKVNENTRVQVLHERRLALEQGEVWLEIGRHPSMFKVLTPDGNVTVFGTVLAVRVADNHTIVTVERGEVQVENETSFGTLAKGQQVAFESEAEGLIPRRVDVAAVTQWKKRIQEDRQATQRFRTMFIAPKTEPVELPAKQLIWFADVSLTGRVSSVRLHFDEGADQRQHCGYDVYVYDDNRNPLFKGRLDGAIYFEEGRQRQSWELFSPGGPIRGGQRLIIRVLPDYGSGFTDTLVDVSAVTEWPRDGDLMTI